MTIKQTAVGPLTVTQQINLTDITLDKEYDLVLGALSWEKRCVAGFSCIKNLNAPINLLRFASTQPEYDIIKDRYLDEFRKTDLSVNVVELFVSTRFEENVEKIKQLIKDKYTKTRRPLKILIDISCLPKAYLLFIIGYGLNSEFVGRLDCVYAEGDYAETTMRGDGAYDSDKQIGLISEGEWKALQIPYLEADVVLPSQRDVIVTMGGEVGLSLPFIERYEPHRLSLVLISESLIQTPEKLPDTERVALKELLSEPNVERVNISLCDTIEVVKVANTLAAEADNQTVTALALGSKPHALALAIAAHCNDNLEVICRIPKRYRPLDVDSNGRFAFYEIIDRFEPSAYF